jgi:hypothetical protein
MLRVLFLAPPVLFSAQFMVALSILFRVVVQDQTQQRRPQQRRLPRVCRALCLVSVLSASLRICSVCGFGLAAAAAAGHPAAQLPGPVSKVLLLQIGLWN